MDAALVVSIGVVAVVLVNAWAKRVGVAAPLILVAVGVAVSFLPFVSAVEIEPEWILAGVLPPLLYSAAVSMPTMDFRRDFGTIGGLSVVLVVLTSVVLGYFFAWAIPDIGLATGIALGAVVSPTDAVATSIVKRLGVPPRVVTVLEGESLLNDASALVILRSAIAASAVSVSLWGVAGDFLKSVVIAVAVGAVVGVLNLRVRAAVKDAAASTAISFITPFVAFAPAEHFGASGLVAAVTAGLITGQGSAKYLRAQDRLSETTNWATIEVLLEGGVFLTMGLQLFGFVDEVRDEHGSIASALWLGAAAVGIALVLRSGYVGAVLWAGRHQRYDADEFRDRVAQGEEFFRQQQEHPELQKGPSNPDRLARRQASWVRRVTQRVADMDYLAAQPLRRREGAVLVWAGMRGAVTVAAAQSLPGGDGPGATPQRALLILIAFVAAGGSLLVQGGTLGWVVRRLGLGGFRQGADEERARLLAAMAEASIAVVDDPDLRRPDGSPYTPRVLEITRKRAQFEQDEERREHTRQVTDELHDLSLQIIAAQRDVLLEARSLGTFSSAALTSALGVLDADQIRIELQGGNGEDE
ncbi:sodium:proton antiporter [Cellulomonas sp. PhB150]|uniref:cation:proton antiporter n=1 Tax=Cellulomonas sp. PhB150 TaxID=2485188 RepID=UPI000F473B53|nr:sodium:proton antiporter [Cellulomonas sp. PhB150]ROS30586.1 sodium/proton antiporter (CPA1 family) [Cellulomonas sp. PhB150]